MKQQPPLQVISGDSGQFADSSDKRSAGRQESQARFERMWLLNPEQFDPFRNCEGRERISRTVDLITRNIELFGKVTVDLGCGKGRVTAAISEKGALVDAVDVSSLALKNLREKKLERVKAVQDCLPMTLLKEECYDLVICTDVVAFLLPKEHRLLVNEFSRLVKKDGFVICSTPVDIYSEDALQKFVALAQTELDIQDWVLSYHRLYISIRRMLKIPENYVRAWKDQQILEGQLAERSSLGKGWFKLNSRAPLVYAWMIFKPISNVIDRILRQSRIFMLILESFTKFFFGQDGISHVILLAKRRPLVEPVVESVSQQERKVKKRVWE